MFKETPCHSLLTEFLTGTMSSAIVRRNRTQPKTYGHRTLQHTVRVCSDDFDSHILTAIVCLPYIPKTTPVLWSPAPVVTNVGHESSRNEFM